MTAGFPFSIDAGDRRSDFIRWSSKAGRVVLLVIGSAFAARNPAWIGKMQRRKPRHIEPDQTCRLVAGARTMSVAVPLSQAGRGQSDCTAESVRPLAISGLGECSWPNGTVVVCGLYPGR